MSESKLARRVPVVAVLVASVVMTFAPVASANPISESKGFRKAVTVEGIREHQLALQAIADANGGTRAVGTAGLRRLRGLHREPGRSRWLRGQPGRVHLCRGLQRGLAAGPGGDRARTPDVRGRHATGVRRGLRVVHRKRRCDRPCPGDRPSSPTHPGSERIDQRLRTGGLRRLRPGQHRPDAAGDLPVRPEGRPRPSGAGLRVHHLQRGSAGPHRCSQQPSARRRRHPHPECRHELRRRRRPRTTREPSLGSRPRSSNNSVTAST